MNLARAQDWYTLFIHLLRFATVVLGATFSGLLVLNARRNWRDYTRPERYGFWTLLLYAINVTGFTALVIGQNLVPSMPNSLIYFGWIVSFILGYQMIYHTRRIR